MDLNEYALSGSCAPPAPPTVFVVDDDISIRNSLELLIECAGWRPFVYGSASEFLSLPRVHAPSCLILDVALPGIGGFEVQKLLADRVDMPIIFISGYADVPMTVRAMKAGAAEFLMKPFREEALLNAIRDAIDRSHAALSRDAGMQALRARYATLSRREREVMALVVVGRLNKQVGGELGISEITVKAHRGKMMRKMHARSLGHLLGMAAALGSISSPTS